MRDEQKRELRLMAKGKRIAGDPVSADAIEAALKEVEAFDLLVKDAAQDHRDGRISPGYYAALIALAENARNPQ